MPWKSFTVGLACGQPRALVLSTGRVGCASGWIMFMWHILRADEVAFRRGEARAAREASAARARRRGHAGRAGACGEGKRTCSRAGALEM